MIKGCNKLPTLSNLLKKLDQEFKEKLWTIIRDNGRGSSLLRLLKLVSDDNVEFPTPLLMQFMRFYSVDHKSNPTYYSFNVRGGQRMNVTLQDVLYLTSLPIIGRAVVPNDSRDNNAFHRVFSVHEDRKLITLDELQSLCTDLSRNEEERIKAVLLMIVTCLITPDGNGHNCNTSYVKFIENLDEVDSFAWGAALLAYLYRGMKKHILKQKNLDGFLWLILGFFFYHFKELFDIFDIDGDQVMTPAVGVPMIFPLIEKLSPIGKNHHSKIDNALDVKIDRVRVLLENVEVEGITWDPYT
ncbi:unnamed protein product [Trifolium pratense]|uniref:Uncharacterized protein n=1 Tax=Trifolium pratense TaxID=57577 RepID=A0ACB0IY20_TRIPR|nr:unnamed protein product [Trifolium pratense]